MVADLTLVVEGLSEKRGIHLSVKKLILCTYSGRNIEIVKKHIKEAGQEGIPPPAEIPQFYFLTPNILTTDNIINCDSTNTSGEIEYVIILHGNEIYIGVGSDHTDRMLETKNVEESKEACPKPISKEVWAYRDVKDHWDECILRCEVAENNSWRVYQEGKVELLLSVEDILSKLSNKYQISGEEDIVIFSGTIPTVAGKIEYLPKYKMGLVDPILDRKLELKYTLRY